MTADHTELVATLDALRADMTALVATPKDGRAKIRQALLDRVVGFKDAVSVIGYYCWDTPVCSVADSCPRTWRQFFAHLREEEDTMCVVSAQHLSPKHEKELVKRISEGTGGERLLQGS